ncbi:MAG: hypothetical protein CFH19_00772 [Alphaproteobacteria bacterium MarineAlpha5_Bin9]|nr:MAG: hypothetical protein CFH19_00772 [Alphaproteobacteria bacterium MarineAlpha5_Bin9]|tara:strand:+ start:2866 stop:3312 length:447 start_codon:yes stop_codon:yes gene_type:complete
MKVRLIKVGQKNIRDIGVLFDLYRQFYKYKTAIKESTNYIKERINNNDSIIYACYLRNKAVAFVQLYETFDSLNLNKKLVLYDLYVLENYRNKGIAKILMKKAKEFAIKKKYKIIELSTAITNKKAQYLYESLDYKKDKEYYNYYLEI